MNFNATHLFSPYNSHIFKGSYIALNLLFIIIHNVQKVELF
jgi:hypothetical protein